MKKISSKLKLLVNTIGRRWSEDCDENEEEEETKDSFFRNEENEVPGVSFIRMDSNGCILSPPASGMKERLSMRPPDDSATMNYVLKEKIGEGAYGRVYRSEDLKTKKEYAIKISRLTDENCKYLVNELNLMKKLKSPHIVAVYEGFTVANKLWLVMEHCIGGSILDVMKVRKINSLNEPLMKGVIASLLLALSFLHEHRVIHRDVKASNVVLTVGGKIKLIDFGVAAEINEGEEHKNTVIGSPYWMAPEVIEGGDYDEKADVWSLGMTVLELCDPKHPLFSIPPVSVLFKIVTADAPCMRDSFHPNFSSEIYDFFSKCMQKDPVARWSSQALLAHAWVHRTVDDIITGGEENSSASCVDVLEQLFVDYMLDEDVQVLPWDDTDELEVTQGTAGPQVPQSPSTLVSNDGF